ncbi:MAG TPA: hypothetical protein VMB18_15380 [Terriglobales bacterium]|nr:hypothetical protein [Terriglobales bacterium]
MTCISRTLAAVTLIGLLVAVGAGSAFAATHYYVVGNNNAFPTNSLSIYEVSGTALVSVSTVNTGGEGAGGGYFGQVRQSITRDGSSTCVFAGDEDSGDVAALKVISSKPYLALVSDYFSPDGDAGSSDGIGITVSGSYLYANYTGNGANIAPSIGVWQIGSGCTLTFVTHITGTTGLNGGEIDGMAATPNGKYLVVAYGDGSVGSYAIGGGNISLINQETISGSGVGAGASAGSVAISSNGQWAIFGDFSLSNNTQLDVANIGSNGALAPTTTYGGTGSLGDGIDSNGIALSPDNRFIYVADSYSGQETTVAFDATTGVITYPNPCLTSLHGYNTNWTYVSQVATAANSGSGGGLYMSEGFLSTGSTDSYIALLQVDSTTGCAVEAPHSPFIDPNGDALESITSYSH